VVGPPKSIEGIRSVHLPGWCSKLVVAHLREFVPDAGTALLFAADPRGEYADNCWRSAWDAARATVGVLGEVREHDLRHYYGTALANAGVSAVVLKSAMGHANISTTMAYVHTQNGTSPDVADLLPEPIARSVY